jgi:ribonucleoside-diphosphate reductase alpha chain
MYEDGMPGEIFIVMAKEGSTISGLMDTIATMISLALQYGVPLSALVNKFSHMRFEPAGFTNNKEIPLAKSIIDYVFRWLGLKFLPVEEQGGGLALELDEEDSKSGNPVAKAAISRVDDLLQIDRAKGFLPQNLEASEVNLIQSQSDAPSCQNCGSIMVRNGACYKCLNCGATSGCS